MIQIAKILGGLVLDYFKSKREEKQAQHQRRLQVINNEHTWDQLAQQNSGDSWKDELWTIVLVIPMVMAFIPTLAPYVKEGFETLETVPDWYKAFAATAVAAAFGRKALAKVWGARADTKGKQ